MLSKFNFIKINLFEAEDGAESIFITYKCVCKGIRIAMIFSDETMNYVKGSSSSQLIGEIVEKTNLPGIPFYLVTALDGLDVNTYKYIREIIQKP